MISLLDYFDATYLINLRERTDRLEAAKTELMRVGWALGSSGVQVFPALKFTDRAGFPNAGIRGAFCSHRECLKRGLAAHNTSVLILEDDVAFSSVVASHGSKIIAQLNASHWDIVYFGHENTGKIPIAESDNIGKHELQLQPWTRDIVGLHFYAIKLSIIPELISHLDRVERGREGDQEFGPMPVDGAINVFRRLNPHVRTLIAVPKIGWQRPSRSDISPKGIDGIMMLRPVVKALRDLKYFIQTRKPS
jgi:glycosyl transferase family 25